MNLNLTLTNPCVTKREFCVNCNSHFMKVRPHIKALVISKSLFKDLHDEKELEAIVKEILDCSTVYFSELHKFEGNVGGTMIFRAKRKRTHIVYCVDKEMKLIFLRAFRDYSQYGNFLRDKKEIRRTIARV